MTYSKIRCFCCFSLIFIGCYADVDEDSLPYPDGGTPVEPHGAPLEPPMFSHTSGFYTDDISLTLSHPDPDVDIIYTIDGSEPNVEALSGVEYSYKNQYAQDPGQKTGKLIAGSFTSNTYSESLKIGDRSSEPNKLANISSTWHFSPDYLPGKRIRKATVVRARAVKNGRISATVTRTYFVSDDSAFSSNLPIVSISLDEDELFDYDDGIYVAGVTFDKWRERYPEAVVHGHRPSNYRRKGKETEKFASFQYFVDGEEMLNQNIGVRIHGAFSRSSQNKSFLLYARKEYDTQKKIAYPFFGDMNSSRFKRLILRNSGNDAGGEWIGKHASGCPSVSPAVYFRDAFVHEMASHLRIDTQDYSPTVVYVNGEYWGLLNIRERYDKHYFERKYGIPEEDLEHLEGNGIVKEGDNVHYLEMKEYIKKNSLTCEDHYNHVKTLVDVDNLIDYSIIQIFVGNTDWPGSNTEYFRMRTGEYDPDTPNYGRDGRWRWLMFDTDQGFGWKGDQSYTYDSLKRVTRITESNDQSTFIQILGRLLENKSFRNSFISRYADLLNTAFQPERMIALIDDMAHRITDEIAYHRERWNTLHNWEEDVASMRSYAEGRPEYARSHIMKRFDIDGELTATLSVSDRVQGRIQINSIEISKETPGIGVTPYPWKGVYFKDIPITVKAVPETGYAFSHWSGASDSGEPVIVITPTGDFDLQANFVPVNDGNVY